jgi:hypothetical protein
MVIKVALEKAAVYISIFNFLHSNHLQTRGYSANDVDKVRRNVKWENKRDILTKREEN